MCKEVQVGLAAKAVMCETVAELRSALKAPTIFVERDAFVARDEDCLCSIDVERTAAAVGMQVREAGVGEGFPFPELIIHSV